MSDEKKTLVSESYPLILVFYLDRELMMNKPILRGFAESVNNTISIREANAMAFFLPTDDKERIECINPQTLPEDKMEEVNKLIEDLKANFDVGQGADDDLETE